MTGAAGSPGIRGDFVGACVVCMRGTDTALTFRGIAEWAIAGLVTLGVPEQDAVAMVSSGPGEVPDGELAISVRVCGSCVKRCPASFPMPRLALSGSPVPVIQQPEQTQ